MTINPKAFTEALAQQREAEKCKHPTEAIRDLPDRSYCRKCNQDVPPPGRYDDGSGPGQNKMTLTLEEFSERFVGPNYARTQEHIELEAKPPYETTIDWMGRIKKSIFPVFPSSGEE